MTVIQIPWATGGKYVKLVCRLGEPRPGHNTDLITQGGSVKLTCDAERIRYEENDGRFRVLPSRTWTFAIRESDGELYDASSDDGGVGVYVLSGLSDRIEPAGFTWTATIKPNFGDSWKVTIPLIDSEEFDLAAAPESPFNRARPDAMRQAVSFLQNRMRFLVGDVSEIREQIDLISENDSTGVFVPDLTVLFDNKLI